ncbi:hypothetical protein EDD22DRAFT_864574 [Suillus occidentalis]|nr:hypothetical protein EDD22DRAFT_864574 [Suillus occidentalis]
MEVIDLTNLPISDDEGGSVSYEELENAVYGMTEARLRKIVIRLADRIPAFRSALVKEAIVVSGKKRKAVPRWDVCANCEEEYEVSDEREEGSAAIIQVVWTSMRIFLQTTTNGVMVPWIQRRTEAEFPEGFNWDCCGGDALSEGCETGQHATGGKFKKRR